MILDLRSTFSYTVPVENQDIDELGHVNNTVYLRYAEEIARAHSEARGMSLAAFKACGVVPVVQRHLITYHQSAVFGDSLRVSTQVTAFKGARAGRHTEIYRLGSGPQQEVLLAEVETDWVWLSAERNRPTRAPKAVLEAFGVAGDRKHSS